MSMVKIVVGSRSILYKGVVWRPGTVVEVPTAVWPSLQASGCHLLEQVDTAPGRRQNMPSRPASPSPSLSSGEGEALSLNDKTVKELRQLAKERDITGGSRMKKAELIEALS